MEKYRVITVRDEHENLIAVIFPILERKSEDYLELYEKTIRERYIGYTVSFISMTFEDIQKEVNDWMDNGFYNMRCCVYFGNEEEPTYLAFFDDRDDALGFIADSETSDSYIFNLEDMEERETIFGSKDRKRNWFSINAIVPHEDEE